MHLAVIVAIGQLADEEGAVLRVSGSCTAPLLRDCDRLAAVGALFCTARKRLAS